MDRSDLRERRNKAKLTQAQLAERLGVSANTVARWERGEVPIPPYLELALETIETKLSKNKLP